MAPAQSPAPAPPDAPAPSTATLPPKQRPDEREGYAKLTHRLSIWLLIACPAIALLPPRKLDLYTVGLGGMTLVAAEHLARERTGRTILQRLGGGFDGAVQPADHMPTERARQVQELQRRAREEREALLRSQAAAVGQDGEEEERSKRQSALQRVWMGGETEGWRERRLKEEREAIEEGRGYGDLIMDQIWEVWNWGKGKTSTTAAEDDDIARNGGSGSGSGKN